MGTHIYIYIYILYIYIIYIIYIYYIYIYYIYNGCNLYKFYPLPTQTLEAKFNVPVLFWVVKGLKFHEGGCF